MPELKTEVASPVARNTPRTLEELSKILELPLLAPELTDDQIAAGCNLARRYGLAAVIVRPSDLDSSERWALSPVALGAVIDWPHGYSTTAVKQYAARDALRRGAKEITVTMNTSKLISRQFQYLEMELLQIVQACHEVRALLTVNLESRHLSEEHKIVACRVVKRVEADFLATPDLRDVAFLAQYTQDRVLLKLRDATTLDVALEAYAAGCKRIETPNPAEILESLKILLASADDPLSEPRA
jgi:deoxyribose-phosphate aldolase